MEKILVIATHPDDEVLGCGGTIARHVRSGDEIFLCIVTRGFPPDWDEAVDDEIKRQVSRVSEILRIKQVRFLDLPAAKLDTIPQKELNEHISKYVEEVQPQTVYIPHRGDIHKDHQLIFDATMVSVRPQPRVTIKRVLCYEVLSETEWAAPFPENAFIPNVYVDISATLEIKLKAMSEYKTQLREFPHPRSSEAVSALAKVRGATIGVEAAEAFALIRESR